MQIMVHYARAIGRLVSIVWITHHQIAKILFQSAFFERTPELSARHAMQWAGRLVRAAGIDVAFHGPVPSRASLLVANHRSYIDIVAILSRLPCSFLAKAELLKWPVFGPAARLGGTIFVDRNNPKSRSGSRSRLAAKMARGVSIVVFPEGTTHGGPGLLEFHKGVFHIAAEKSFSVTPVMILYEDPAAAWTGTATFVPHFLTIFGRPSIRMQVVFGPEIVDGDPDRIREAAHAWIERQLEQREETGDL